MKRETLNPGNSDIPESPLPNDASESALLRGDAYFKRLSGMTPAEKLLLSLELYESARVLKGGALRMLYPGWNDGRVDEEVRRIFANAST